MVWLKYFVVLFNILRFSEAIPLRFCKNTIHNVTVSEPMVYYRPLLHHKGNLTTIALQLIVEWNVTSERDFEFDGFLVYLRKSSSSPHSSSITPNNICQLSKGDFWTKSGVSCSHKTNCDAQCRCKCDGDVIKSNMNCKGIISWLEIGMFSISAKVRELKFNVEFYTNYRLKIFPYYNQSILSASLTKVEEVNDCSKLLSTNLQITEKEATKLCCDSGVKQYLVRNVTFSNPIPDFENKNINVTVQWLPPITDEYVTGYQVTASAQGTKPVKSVIAAPQTAPLADCLGSFAPLQVVLSPLQVSVDYMVIIISQHRQGMTSCNKDKCLHVINVTFPVVDLCKLEYNYCDVNASCTFNSNSSKWHVSCTCHNGFHGDGTHGNCKKINFCQNCSDDAKCNEMTSSCDCPFLYYGDGLELGQGCVNRVWLAVLISSLLLLIMMSTMIILIRRYLKHKKLRYDILWSQFISNSTFNYDVTQKLSSDQKTWLPTFGQKWEIDRSDVTFDDVIGRGNYGVVYKGYYKTGEVAVKMLQESKSCSNTLEFLAEIGFMLNIVEHPNILSVVGCCTTQNPILLITELLEYGDLLHFLIEAREPEKRKKNKIYDITLQSVYNIALQIAHGMEYLTLNRIIHGDLAARNILVGEGLKCKISDFGLANDVYRYGVIKGQMEKCVPLKWISPERMMCGEIPITSKSDVWSFGNLLYEVVTLGCAPYPDITADEILDKLKSGYRMKKPDSCPKHLYEVMLVCWRWKSYDRPSFKKLRQELASPPLWRDDALSINI